MMLLVYENALPAPAWTAMSCNLCGKRFSILILKRQGETWCIPNDLNGHRSKEVASVRILIHNNRKVKH